MSLTLLQPKPLLLEPPHAPSLAEQWQLLRRRWRLIAAFTVMFTLPAGIYLFHMPPSYTATGVMLYDPANAATPGDPIAPPAADEQNEAALTASQTEVIASLPASVEIAARLHLAGQPEFKAASGPNALALAVRRHLTVAVIPDSRLITASFTAATPARAAAGANLAMQLYLDHERAAAIGSLDEAQGWLQTNAALLEQSLAATETALAKARAAAGVVAGAQGTLTTETVSRIAASLVAAQADLAMDQARLAAANQGAAANAAIAPNLLPLRKEQADLAGQVNSLARAYGPAYPPLAAARTSLATITDEIGAETGREIAAAQAEVAADQAEIKTLAGSLAAARSEAQLQDALTAPITVLQERADAGRDMLQHMTLQADQLAQEASLIRPDARIVSLAVPPDTQTALHRGLFLAAAAGLGLAFGFLAAGLSEALDTTLRHGGDLKTRTGLVCLAQVPEIRRPQTAVLTSPFCLFAEQLRALETALAMAGPGLQIIAITAARPGEGKTTLTIALGRALAAAGRRVIAVDGDIRQPSFDPVFSCGGAAGLTDHLAGLAVLEAVIMQDDLSPLSVIPAGSQARTALSLFMSPALPALLGNLRQRYDLILLDVPPAFALAEGRVLARQADGALLCVRWGHTPRRVVTAAIELLQDARVNLIGAVLTRVDRKAQSRSGYPDAEIYQPRYGGYFRAS